WVYTGTGNVYDYNDYWVPSGSTYLAYMSNYGYFGPALWTTFRSTTFGGANSLNIDPQFISSTNLRHYNNSLNAGINQISLVPNDISGFTRTTPVTIGAAEFKPVANDAGVSAILNNPPCTGVSNYQVRITNYGTSTLTSATINWTINGVAQTPFSWTGSLAQNITSSPITVGTYNFIFGTNYTILSSTSSPNGNTDGNTLNDQLSINTAPALGGTYSIGSGGNYATFSAAVAALQTYGVCAPTTFLVANGTYNELVTIPQITGASAINTITFESQSGDSTLVVLQTNNSYVLYLNGADYIRFQKMTLQNNGSGRVIDFGNTAQFNRIENCRIIGFNTTTNSTTYHLIYKASSGTSERGTEIRNNVFQYGAAGIYWAGYSSLPYDQNIIIENNRFTDMSSYGVFVQYTDGLIIRNNFIDLTNNGSSTQYGIYTQYVYNSTRILSNDVRTKNYAGYFYYTYGAVGQRALIANNFFNAIHPTGGTLYGIYDYYGQYLDYIHNSVTTSNPSASFTSYTLFDQYGSYKTFNNNIFRNNGVAGSNNYTVYLYTGTGNVYDYNDYWWPSGSTYISYWSSYGYFTPALWSTFKTSTYGGVNSINTDPLFLSSTNLRHYNSALNVGVNQISLVGIDIDGVTRTTPVTIGAKEFNPVANDAALFGIVSNPPCSGPSNFQVQIANYGTATLTSATINWTINGVAQTPYSWTGSLAQLGVSSAVTIGTYNFIFGTNYTIQASTSNPNGLTDGNTLNDLASINTAPALGGTYTIGTGGNYTTFASAISALQTYGVCAPTTFLVANGTYFETLVIPQISGASATNTITFQSLSGDSTLVSVLGSSTYVLYLNGADYIRFRKMTLQNNGSGRVIDFANTAQYNMIENCRIIGFNTTVNSSSYYLIYKASTATNERGTEIRNNVLQYGSVGIYWAGFSSSPYEPGLIIENNRIIDMNTYGLYLQYMDAPIIRNNFIDLTNNANAGTQYGIFTQYLYNSTRILSNDVRSKTFAGYFNYTYGQVSFRALIANNFFNATHPTGSTLYGIYDSYGQYTDYIHNSVTTSNPTTGNTSYCLYDNYGSYKNYYNNIFRNNGLAGGSNYSMWVYTGTGNLYDYNDYWCPTGSTYLAYMSNYGYFTPALWTSFRGSSYGGANSVNIDPQFLSATNLRHYNTALNVGVNQISLVGNDIDGITRTTPVTIGAKEFNPVANDAAVSNIVSNPPCTGVANFQVQVANYGTSTLTSATINWTVNGVAQTPFSWTGSLVQNAQTTAINIGTYNFIFGTNYTITVATSNPNGFTDGNTGNDQMSINGAPALGGTYTIGSGGNYTTFASAIAALQTYGVCAPTTFLVANGTYFETLIIPQISGASSINTITFQSQSGDSTQVNLMGSSTYVLYLNGADYIRIRKMTLQNTGAGRVIDFGNTAQYNRIENCRIVGFNTTINSSTYYLIYKASSGTNEAGTEIRNNVFQFGAAGVYWAGFSSSPYEPGLIIENNRITDISTYGVFVQYTDGAIIRNNFIDLTGNGSSTQYGIYTQYVYNSTRILSNDVRTKNYAGYFYYTYGQVATRALIANNFFNATHPTGNTLYGIYDYYGQYTDYIHNSITTSNPTTGNTSYGLMDNYGSYKNYYNNIFRNNGVAGTSNYSMWVYTGTGNIFDYNDYWVPSGSTYLAYMSNYGYFTPALWTTFRNSTYGGVNSINIDPLFLSATNLRHYNSNLNVGINQISLVGTDIDGVTRTAPVTIGAKEFNPVANDAAVSNIVSNPPCTGVSNFQVQVANYGTSTLTSATINWSVNGVSQTPFSWTGSLGQNVVSGPVTVGTYNFIFGTNYTILASTSNPNGFTDGNTGNDQLSINAAPALGGTYTIGSGGNYASFSAAIAALQTYGVCAPTTFLVVNGTYFETLTIPQITGANATNTITFQSLSGDSSLVSLQGSSTNVIFLNGADYIRFRKMTIQNVGSGRVIDFGGTAQFNRIENCRIIGFNTTTNSTSFALIFKGSAGTNETGTEIRNNVLQYGAYGIYWAGFSSSPYESGMIVENNRIVDMNSYGIFIQYMDGAIIRNNIIDLTNNASTNQYGISAQYMYNSTRILANDVRVKNYPGYFQYLYGAVAQRALIANNFFNANHPTGNTIYGIYDYGSNYTDYIHNTVTTTNGSSIYATYTLYDNYGSYKNYLNNIFRNNGPASTNNYCAYVYTGTSNVYNYNDYWWPTGSSYIAYWSSYGTFAPAIWTTFRSTSYGGANSVNIDPLFLSSTNLRHYNNSLNAGINQISLVANDIDGITRTTPVTIGASEFKPVANDAAVSSIVSNPPCTGVSNFQVQISNYGTSTLTSATINWTVNGVAQTPFSWTGSLVQNAVSTPITIGTYNFLFGTNYTITSATSLPNGVTDGNTLNDQMSINTAPALGGTYTIGAGGTYASFSAAVAALQSYGVCAPTTFLVVNGTYFETVVIPQITGANSINTITFQSQSGDSTLVNLQGSSTYVLFLNGADFIRIRKMTIQNTGAGRVIDFGGTAQNNRIENCRIIGFNTTTNSTSYALIYKGSAGTNESGTEIRNNVMQYGAHGLYWLGFSSSPYESGMIFENNRVTDMNTYGVYMQYMNGAVIRNNFIDLTNNASTTQYGIYTQYLYNSTRILSNDVRTKTFGGYFYYTYGASGQRALIANNFFNATHPTGTTIYGIYDYYGQYIDYFHNTATTTNPTSGNTSYCLMDNYGSYKNFYNNIFRNNGVAGGNNYSIWVYTGTGNVYDYNDYWVPSGSTYLAYMSNYGYFAPGLWTTFRSTTYGGGNSLNIDPLFLSATNLRHYNNSLNAGVNQISLVPNDISGITRTTPVTIGAAEFKPVALDAAVASIVNNPPCSGPSNFQVTVANYGTTTLTSATVNWTLNGVAQTPFSWTGSLAQNAVSSPVTVGTFNFVAGTNYTILASTSSPNGGTDGNTVNDQITINTAPALGGTYTIGTGGTYPTFASAVSALQTYGVCSPTTFLVANGSYNETIIIPQISGASSINTITFISQANDSTQVTLLGSSTYVVYLNGADYIRFQKITIQNVGTGRVIDFANNAQNNRIENCRILGYNSTVNSTTYSLIFKGSSATNESGTEIRNNVLQYGAHGIYWAGFSSLPYESGMIFENNRVTDMGGYGVYMTYMDGAVIRNNFIDLTNNGSTSQYGIYTQYMYNSTRVLANDVRAKNFGGYFYYTYGASGQRALIANNFFNVTNPTGATIYGLYDYYGQYLDYIHNTVTTTNPTAGNTSYTLYDNYGSYKNYYNNIFRNNGVAGGSNYCVYVWTGTGNVFDYNDYWWPSGSSLIGYWSSWGNFTVGNWSTFRTSTYGGANSINTDPQFLSATNLRHYNISMNFGLNQLSLVNRDIDGVTRTTPITIGASEFKPVVNDAALSSIVNNPPCSGPSNFQVLIANYGTANLTSATINWSINGVSQTPYSWTGFLSNNTVSSPVTIGTYNFIAGTNYTIVASTSSPNGLTDGNLLNDQLTINSAPALGGTYTIGTGGNYATFAAAVAALQTYGVCSPTTFKVVSGSYNETVIIPQITGASTINTITFESLSGDSTTVSLLGSSTYVLYLNGADNIRFRKMTIQNVGAGRVIDFANNAQFNRIENCRIIGFNSTTNSSAYYLIYKASTATAETGTEIRNNVLQYGSAGIYWAGYTSLPYETGLIIENNRMTDMNTYGVYIQYTTGLIVRNNLIDLTNNGSTTQYGIYTQYVYNNTRILANDVRTKSFAGYFYYTYGAVGQRALIANNFFNVSHPTGTTLYGIYDYYGQYTDYLHNTVTTTNPTSGFTSYTIYDNYGSYKNFYNNIFRNNGAAGSSNYVFYVYTGTGNVYDYNDYWWPTGTTNLGYWSSWGTFTPATWTTFRTSTYGGSNSVNIDPQFLSTTNLRHYTNSLNAGLNQLSLVNTDIDGATRTTPVTIGADEFKPVANDAGVSAILNNPPCPGVSNVQVRLTNFGTNTISSASVNWSVNGVTQTPFSWSGSLLQNGIVSPVTIGTFNFVFGTNYTINAWTSNPNGVTDGNLSNDQTSLITAPALGGTYTIGATGNYTSFSAAVSDLQAYGVCAPTTFLVQNGTYIETMMIPQISGASSINTITFISQSGDSSLVNLQGSGTYVLFLNGADYFRFQKITIQNTGSGRVIDFGGTAQFNRIENCRIIGFNTTVNSTAYALIYKASSTTSEAGTEIRNNVLQYGSHGLYWTGYSSSPYEPGMIFENNRVTDMNTYGVFMQYMNGAVIRKNQVDLTANGSASQYGIYTQYMYNSTRILQNDVRTKNYAGYFYYTYGAVGQRALIANNFFTVINTGGATLYGLYDYYGQYLDYFHNSVTTTNGNATATSYTVYDNYGSYK
ncbi:MAG: hypothetical protein EBX50_08640, partial [Chitinophagia bacterium]|nr:hypothetical protein [Chitinophagia bacterium]